MITKADFIKTFEAYPDTAELIIKSASGVPWTIDEKALRVRIVTDEFNEKKDKIILEIK